MRERKNPIGLVEKILACMLLVALLPMLFLVALLIHATAGKPAILCDEFPNGTGGTAWRLHFRTTGPGTPFFRALGRFLRRYSIDEFPALWSFVRGDVKLWKFSRTSNGHV